MPGLLALTSEIVMSDASTSAQFNESFANTFATATPPANPFTLEPASLLAAIGPVTIRLVEHELVFPQASFAVMLMLVVPGPTSVPAAGDCEIEIMFAAVQLSLAVTLVVKSGTSAWQLLPVATV